MDLPSPFKSSEAAHSPILSPSPQSSAPRSTVRDSIKIQLPKQYTRSKSAASRPPPLSPESTDRRNYFTTRKMSYAFGSSTPREFSYLDHIPLQYRVYNVRLRSRRRKGDPTLKDYLREVHTSPTRRPRDLSVDSSLARIYAFGSCTPRDLSYLDKVTKDMRVYDVRLRPSIDQQKRSKTTSFSSPGSTQGQRYMRRTSSMENVAKAKRAKSAPRPTETKPPAAVHKPRPIYKKKVVTGETPPVKGMIVAPHAGDMQFELDMVDLQHDELVPSEPPETEHVVNAQDQLQHEIRAGEQEPELEPEQEGIASHGSLEQVDDEVHATTVNQNTLTPSGLQSPTPSPPPSKEEQPIHHQDEFPENDAAIPQEITDRLHDFIADTTEIIQEKFQDLKDNIQDQMEDEHIQDKAHENDDYENESVKSHQSGLQSDAVESIPEEHPEHVITDPMEESVHMVTSAVQEVIRDQDHKDEDQFTTHSEEHHKEQQMGHSNVENISQLNEARLVEENAEIEANESNDVEEHAAKAESVSSHATDVSDAHHYDSDNESKGESFHIDQYVRRPDHESEDETNAQVEDHSDEDKLPVYVHDEARTVEDTGDGALEREVGIVNASAYETHSHQQHHIAYTTQSIHDEQEDDRSKDASESGSVQEHEEVRSQHHMSDSGSIQEHEEVRSQHHMSDSGSIQEHEEVRSQHHMSDSGSIQEHEEVRSQQHVSDSGSVQEHMSDSGSVEEHEEVHSQKVLSDLENEVQQSEDSHSIYSQESAKSGRSGFFQGLADKMHDLVDTAVDKVGDVAQDIFDKHDNESEDGGGSKHGDHGDTIDDDTEKRVETDNDYKDKPLVDEQFDVKYTTVSSEENELAMEHIAEDIVQDALDASNLHADDHISPASSPRSMDTSDQEDTTQTGDNIPEVVDGTMIITANHVDTEGADMNGNDDLINTTMVSSIYSTDNKPTVHNEHAVNALHDADEANLKWNQQLDSSDTF